MFESTHVRENDSPKKKLSIECHMRRHTPTSCKGTKEVSTKHESQAFLMSTKQTKVRENMWRDADVDQVLEHIERTGSEGDRSLGIWGCWIAIPLEEWEHNARFPDGRWTAHSGMMMKKDEGKRRYLKKCILKSEKGRRSAPGADS